MDKVTYNHICSLYKDCSYYKQLKRLQAENFELKKHQCSFENCDNFERYSTQIHELTKENEDLKTYIKRMDKPEIKTIDSEIALKNIELQAENERLKEENYGLNQELLGYKKGVQASEIIELKQALQEIREIVETCLKLYKCEKCKFYKECQYDLEEYIITKINSVIGAE